MDEQPVILSTRPLPDALVQAALEQGVTIDISPFIDTVPVDTIEVISEVETALQLSITVIFTSQNAVEAVGSILPHEAPPEWRIYSIGEATREAVVHYFGEDRLAGTAPDAEALADLIIEEDEGDEVYFFCGDKRRPELPEKLEEAGIMLTEIVVYETILLPHAIKNHYAGVLFFSPSAAESFFSLNQLEEHTIAFAIGKTTAAAIRRFTNNMIITADAPDKDNLVMKALEILTT
ncbi:uroporphyrinogen-III synthase [Flavihumibacter petaseus]|uniref:Uroporphyrinogen-III synthase n=1 Tax=Flavihumibacter petaseus NBRC 106054 TaxID=1220578 RepID=A0A0E9MWH0_9BACT|nr:uroporphyrinogen-III synthase [Flavihumibacter petaseus]GAO41786.1 uroporphyrinogen-III synthase [Flavihumibacter petaseus NBRC 106054]